VGSCFGSGTGSEMGLSPREPRSFSMVAKVASNCVCHGSVLSKMCRVCFDKGRKRRLREGSVTTEDPDFLWDHITGQTFIRWLRVLVVIGPTANVTHLFFSGGKKVVRKEYLCNIESDFDLEEPSY
jgi:hypothetical protein